MNIHAMVSFIAACSNLFLGFYVYRMNRGERVNRIFSLNLIFLSLWCVMEGIMRSMSQASSALFWTKIAFLFSSWLPVLFVYFILNFTRQEGRWRFFYLLFPLFFNLLLLSDILFDTDLFVLGVFLGHWGFYDEKASFGYYLYMAYIMIFFSGGLGLLLKTYRSEGKTEEKRKIFYALLCAPIPVLLGGFSEILMKFAGLPAYPLASFSTLSFLILFFGAGFHAHLFTPSAEDASASEPKYRLEEKTSFISFDVQTHDIFLDMIRHGHEGLLVTSKSSAEVEAIYGLKRTPVIFLSHEGGKHNVPPEDLNKLGFFLGEFLKESKKSIIYFDDVETLLEKNGFNHTLRFLHSVNDLVVIYSSILLLNLREEALNEIQANLLLREFTHIKKEPSRDSYISRFIRM